MYRRNPPLQLQLLHPDRPGATPCEVGVSVRGLVLRRTGSEAPGAPLRIPWWAVAGLDADGIEDVEGLGTLQVVAVATDAGTLSLAATAADVSVLLRRVAGHARWWRTSRGRRVGGVMRAGAVVSGTAARRLWSLRRHPIPRSGSAPVRPALAVLMGAVLLAGPAIEMAVSGPGVSGVASAASRAHAVDRSPWRGLHNGALRPSGSSAVSLPPATTPPAPAPPSLADQPALRPHELFGFAPYWTLDQSSGFDVSGLTTIAYFSVDVNANGTLDQSGPGWDGYQSQALADLVTRAHAAGSRVVLTVTCFDQATLDQVTSSPAAAATLAQQVLQAVQAKNLDGVNIDFEGEGSADQVGLTALVDKVSSTMHAADPHYQVTMDTYASSAGDPGGFYDIRALAPSVDGFFVMAYELNLSASASPSSPLTSSMFSNQTAAEQYAAAVPPSKVILGVPYYGYDWPTTDGTLSAQATGPPSTPSDAQIAAAGHPVYWDPVTDTAWTSYQVGSQWHEAFFEDPTSLYFEAQMAQSLGLAGLGIWALGMDGNDPQMLGALLGFAPAVKDSALGPSSTSGSAAAAPGTTTTTTAPNASPGSSSSTTTTTSPVVTTTTSGSPSPSSTTTTAPTSTTTTTIGYQYGGTFQSQQVQGEKVPLTKVPPSEQQSVTTGTATLLGTLSTFTTNDPGTVSCLTAQTESTAPQPNTLSVYEYIPNGGPAPSVAVVVASSATGVGDCTDAYFTFPLSYTQAQSNGGSNPGITTGSTTTTTTSTTTTSTTTTSTTTTSTTTTSTTSTTTSTTATNATDAPTTTTTGR
jgi:hypothetical protein